MSEHRNAFWRRVRVKPSKLALACAAVYVSAAALSVMAAHVMHIIRPESLWSERLIAPVAKGIEFLDAHWKAVLILAAPFAAPVARALIPRLRKVWGFEFDAEPVSLESEGVREKPAPSPQGETQ